MITPHQRKQLAQAAAGDGEVSRWAAGRKTIDALLAQKLIAPDQRMRNKTDRRKEERDRDRLIKAAGEQLAAGNWQHALAFLKRAASHQGNLDATAWYITPLGVQAVGPTSGPSKA